MLPLSSRPTLATVTRWAPVMRVTGSPDAPLMTTSNDGISNAPSSKAVSSSWSKETVESSGRAAGCACWAVTSKGATSGGSGQLTVSSGLWVTVTKRRIGSPTVIVVGSTVVSSDGCAVAVEVIHSAIATARLVRGARIIGIGVPAGGKSASGDRHTGYQR